SDTIRGGGCAVTATAMALNTADPTGALTLSPPRSSLNSYPAPFINPGGLASFLAAPASNPNREPPLTPDGKINFNDAPRAVSNGSFRLVPPPGGQIDSITQPINAANQLAQSVCGNNLPVLVGVNLTQQNGTVKAGHFVLVTGVDTDTNGIPS